MYGTIARLQVKPGAFEQMRALGDGDKPPGHVAVYIYQMDSNPNELYLVAVFESKEAYVANAQSPEQHTRYEQMRALLTAEPEWHDGEVIFAN
jgi:quinol monooxygenase YgiN